MLSEQTSFLDVSPQIRSGVTSYDVHGATRDLISITRCCLQPSLLTFFSSVLRGPLPGRRNEKLRDR